MSRPLFQKSISELEELFAEWQAAPEQLKALRAELLHRKRPKPVRLRERVEALLGGVGSAAHESSRATQQEFREGKKEQQGRRANKATGSRLATGASTSGQNYLDPPNEFTISCRWCHCATAAAIFKYQGTQLWTPERRLFVRSYTPAINT